MLLCNSASLPKKQDIIAVEMTNCIASSKPGSVFFYYPLFNRGRKFSSLTWKPMNHVTREMMLVAC